MIEATTHTIKYSVSIGSEAATWSHTRALFGKGFVRLSVPVHDLACLARLADKTL
jgi:hypothetical protein